MYLSPRWCGYICCWVVIVSLANSQSPIQALKRNLAKIKEETAKVKTESKSLRAELQNTQALIDARAEEYQSEIEPIHEEMGLTMKSLTGIAYNINLLELEVERKNETLALLRHLRAETEFALKVAKEDVVLLENRRKLGIEDECFKFNKGFMMFKKVNNMPPESHSAVATNSSSNVTSKGGISARSLGRNRTNIVMLAAMTTTAEAELFTAREEQKRLQNDLQLKKLLLEKNEASLQEDVKNMAKALESTQQAHKELQDIFDDLENTIRELDVAIGEESAILNRLTKYWEQAHSLTKAVFKSGIDCYQNIPEKMESSLQVYSQLTKDPTTQALPE